MYIIKLLTLKKLHFKTHKYVTLDLLPQLLPPPPHSTISLDTFSLLFMPLYLVCCVQETLESEFRDLDGMEAGDGDTDVSSQDGDFAGVSSHEFMVLSNEVDTMSSRMELLEVEVSKVRSSIKRILKHLGRVSIVIVRTQFARMHAWRIESRKLHWSIWVGMHKRTRAGNINRRGIAYIIIIIYEKHILWK